MDFKPSPVPYQAEELPRYLDDMLNQVGRALSTSEYQVSPGYMVVDADGDFIGILDDYVFPPKTEQALALIGAQLDADGNVIGLRPVGVRGSEWLMFCTTWQVPGLGLGANQYGYDLQVANDGITVIAVPRPQPAYALIVAAVTDHDLSLTELWTKVTADSAPIANSGTGIPPGSVVNYRVYLHERSDRGGTVDIGFGINGAVPALSLKQEVMGPDSDFLSAGSAEITTLIPDGATFALWCRATNAHGLSDIWAEGSTVETYLKMETR